MKSKQPVVLIVDGANWPSLAEIPRLFKKAGCVVHVFCKKTSWLVGNSYYDKWFECNPSDRHFEKKLTELIKASNYDFVLLGDDKVLERMNNYLVSMPENLVK